MIMPVAPVRPVVDAEIVKPSIDRLVYAAFDDRRQRQPAQRAIPFASIQTVRLHRLHQLERYR